jgi:glutamyl/glutaminyl-tRNA synthetase
VANALHVWGIARQTGAGVVLRIEDHDRQRCRPEFEAALREDLAWLGFKPDTIAGPLRQSERHDRYVVAVERLRSLGHVIYACDCSRKDLAREGGDAPDRETPYGGRCRSRGLDPGPGRGLRLRLGPGPERFSDLRLGPQVQDPAAQCGDLLIKDRLGNWTYQFAVVVDDWEQDIDLVVRGEDLLESTGRQLRLARLLGRPAPPAFYHHRLIHRPGGEKLSKAGRDTAIRDLREAGLGPDLVRGRAAALVGLLRAERPLPLVELSEHPFATGMSIS